MLRVACCMTHAVRLHAQVDHFDSVRASNPPNFDQLRCDAEFMDMLLAALVTPVRRAIYRHGRTLCDALPRAMLHLACRV